MYRKYIKRLLDIVISFVALVVLSPVLLIVAILVRCKLGSPVIFHQERPGYNEKIFKLCKFRSMTDERDEEGNLLPDSVRLTKFGRILRATSLDELPELWNILKGDMSLIGPRPVLTYYPYKWEEYTEEQLKRFNVRPGVTGWAAVHGRKTNTVEARFNYDNYYVEHLSFWLDLKIFFMTIKSVFTNEGNEDNGSAEVKDATEQLPTEQANTEEKE